MAPVAADNKPLSQEIVHINRRRSIIYILANISIALVFAVINEVSDEANMSYAGNFFASASLVMGKINRMRKEEGE